MIQYKLKILVAILGCAMAATACGQQVSGLAQNFGKTAADQVMDWSCVMAGETNELRFPDWRTDKNSVVQWTLLKDDRKLKTGRAESDLEHGDIVVRLDIAEFKSTNVLELKLQLQSGDQAIVQPLFVFADDPFADQIQLLQAANIRLFDPVGNTKTVFKAMQIPFRTLRSLESFDEIENGLIVIGEGVQLGKNKALGTTLAEAVTRGNNVICLAPESGMLVLDMKDGCVVSLTLAVENVYRLESLTLNGFSIVKQYDRRFDERSWAGQSNLKTNLVVTQSVDQITIQPAGKNAGWVAAEFSFQISVNLPNNRNPNPSIIFCGLGIIEHWSAGPVARHLLWQMIKKYSRE